MKKIWIFLLWMGYVAASEYEEDCEYECEEEAECPRPNYIEVDHTYLRDEAEWPTKSSETLIEQLKR